MNPHHTPVVPGTTPPGIPAHITVPRSRSADTPTGWHIVPLGRLANVTRGASPRPIDNPAWFHSRSNIGWLRISDVTAARKYLIHTAQNLSKAGRANSRFVPGGSLVMSICATVGRPIITKKDVCIHDGFVLLDELQVNRDYLYYVLSRMESVWSTRGQTGSQMNLNTDIIKSATVLLPPPAEQHAIAEALSDLDGSLQASEALLAKKLSIKQAFMQQLLTATTRLPGFRSDWKNTRFGQVCTFLPTASNPRSDLAHTGEVGYIHYGDVHSHTQPILNCTQHSLPRIAARRVTNATALRNDDLVMVDASEDLVGVGKSVEVQGIAETPIVAGLHTILCRGDTTEWAAGFKAYLQFIPAFRSALARMAAGTSVYAISKTQLARIELRLPPRSEQAAIVAVLSDIELDILTLEARLHKLRAIKHGMMQELLTGCARLLQAV